MSAIAKFGVAFLACCLLPGVALPQAAADKQDVLKRAGDAYYNLPKEGLASFHCSVSPNFDALEEDLRKSDPAAADARMKQLAQIHIDVTVGADGNASVSHNDLADANLKKIVANTEQMVTSFFQLWSPYVVGTILPAPNGDYQLEDLGSQYRLAFKDGPASAVIMLDKDLSVGAFMITRAEVNSATWPQFSKTANGFLPVSFDSDLRLPARGGAMHVVTSIAYQDVSGFQLPKTIKNKVTSGDNTVQVEVDLSGCTATKR
jgi:hypothetical protein